MAWFCENLRANQHILTDVYVETKNEKWFQLSKNYTFVDCCRYIRDHSNSELRLSFRFEQNNKCIFSIKKFVISDKELIPAELPNINHHKSYKKCYLVGYTWGFFGRVSDSQSDLNRRSGRWRVLVYQKLQWTEMSFFDGNLTAQISIYGCQNFGAWCKSTSRQQKQKKHFCKCQKRWIFYLTGKFSVTSQLNQLKKKKEMLNLYVDNRTQEILGDMYCPTCNNKQFAYVSTN